MSTFEVSNACEGMLFLILRYQSSAFVLIPVLVEILIFFPKDIQYTGKLIGQIITLGFICVFLESKGFKPIPLNDKYLELNTTMVQVNVFLIAHLTIIFN